jgi:hypothetical protein
VHEVRHEWTKCTFRSLVHASGALRFAYAPYTLVDNSEMLGRGKLAVLAMLALAALAAAFAWWWNYNRGREALEFYGPEAAHLIRAAPTVEILIVAGPEARHSPIGLIPRAGSPLRVYRSIDISRAPGLLHARGSLLDDASYRLEAGKIAPPSSSFTEVVRFADGNKELLLAITYPDGSVLDISRGKSMQLVKKTAEGWRSFLKRNVETARKKKEADALQ